jgi:hypothetical protein
MTYQLPTDTQHVSIESRQYRIFTFDLGEGIGRTKALIVALIVVPWVVLMALLGVSILRGAVLYMFPPALVAFRALHTDAGGRPTYAKWLDQCRYWLRRRRPLVPQPGGGQGVSPAFIVHPKWVVLDGAAISKRVQRAEAKQ